MNTRFRFSLGISREREKCRTAVDNEVSGRTKIRGQTGGERSARLSSIHSRFILKLITLQSLL